MEDNNHQKEENCNPAPTNSSAKNVITPGKSSVLTKIDLVLNKWIELQQTIKEVVTLEEIISKQQENNHDVLVNSYKEYFKTILDSRKTFENVINIDNDSNELVDFKLETNNVEKCFSDAYDPVKKLLFLLRTNYDYLLKVIGLIDDYDNFKKDSETLVDLLCHQFYDNILIPNPEQEELLILVFLLLEREVSNMNSASVSSFIDETQSFIGKFLKSYTKKQELKNYLSETLGNLIMKIENNENTCLELNPSKIKAHLYSKKSNAENIEDNYDGLNNNINFGAEYYLTNMIPKCVINIDKKINPDEDNENEDDEDENENEEHVKVYRKKSLDFCNFKFGRNNNDGNFQTEMNKNERDPNINYEYEIDLTQENLNERIQNVKDKNLEEFYLRQLERINRDPEIFTNKKFLQSLTEYGGDQMLILKNYKSNFLFIKETIDSILQSLIDKITTLPYTLRCICKMIHILIQRKFVKISTYERNSFIGEFIFGKCILPILINSDINAVITSTILSNNTRQCLKNIAKVLTKINRGIFFEANSDTDFTIFNHYIIEVIPILNTFYNKLIDVQLPKFLGNLIDEYMKLPVQKRRKSIIRQMQLVKRKEFKEAEKPHEVKRPSIVYDYFKEHPEQSVNIQCICFSMEDILLLVKIIRQKIDDFNGLPQFNFFNKTIERIYNEEHKIYQEIKNSGNVRRFFLVFNEKHNEKILFKKEKDDSTLTADETDSGVILRRVKFCIKTILRGLNLINNKDYSYLNIASSNNKFFKALKYTTNNLNEESDIYSSNTIPLKWYSQYMSNNKKMIPKDYKDNDYDKLYSELLSEEENALRNLRSSSGLLMTRNGMNMRCSEKIIEKAKRDLIRIKEIEKFMKMEKFITKAKIEICIKRKDILDEKQQIRRSKTKKYPNAEQDDQDKELPSIIINESEHCIHNSARDLSTNASNSRSKKDPLVHPKNIKEFIKSISRFEEMKEDIKSGKQDNRCYNTFEMYLKIVNRELQKDSIFANDKEKDKENMLERIEDHIMKKIYSSIFPSKPLFNDNEFYHKTKLLCWVKPAHLEIKKIYESELKYAKDCIRKIDEGRSSYEKLYCIAAAHNTINNTIKFSSGSNSEAGAEELSPIFQYIIIQAQPKRFFSNINYIKAFLHPSKLKGMYGFLLSQMEFSASFILNINYKNLKISEEEFNKNMEEAAKKNTDDD